MALTFDSRRPVSPGDKCRCSGLSWDKEPGAWRRRRPTSVHPLTEALLVFERLVSRQVVLDQLVLKQKLHRRQSVTVVTMSVCEPVNRHEVKR